VDATPPPSDSQEPVRRKRRRRKRRSRPSDPNGAPKRTPRERLTLAAKWTIVALGVLAMGAAAYLMVVYPSKHGPGEGRDVELTLEGDESPEALSARLVAAGLVKDERIFAFYARMSGARGQIARGAHLVTDDLTPRELLNRLERRGSGARMKITLPEGWTRFDMARRLHAQHVCTQHAFLAATESRALLDELHVDGNSAEGFLFPATYELVADSDPSDVVRRLKAEFDKRWFALEQKHPYGVLDLSQSLHWGMREIVILASIIEKEAAVDDERRTIASVFLNRLRDPAFKRKVLQSDPTAGYGCLVMKDELPACASYTGRITHDINVDPQNPYSTYTHEYLPPGPIASPGAKSIEAVMSPATTRYLYFVARGEGRHTFSETYDGHVAAVKDSGPTPARP
jgi:UPF0755 protein